MSNNSSEGIVPVPHTLINKAAKTIASAFASDPSIPYALPDPAKQANLHNIIAYNLKLDLMNGGRVYTVSPECEGVVCWHTPDITSSWLNKLRAGYLRLPFYGGLHYMRFAYQEDRFYARLKSKHAPERCIYLVLLGVDPEHQGKGHGGKLLRHMLQFADSQSLPCYLETQNMKNVNMYSSFGFKLKESTCFPSGSECEAHIMIRDAVYAKAFYTFSGTS